MPGLLRARGRIVGRDDERAQLLSLVSGLSRGIGGAGLVVGSAGVGKSRLVNDVVARAGDVTVLRVQSAEDAVEVPFSGLVGALTLVRRSPGWPALVEGLPRLHALWPGDVAPPSAVADPELERAALVYALVDLIRRLADREPVLLVVDDAQWVDRATLEVLRHLAPAAEDHPVAVLATRRTDLVGNGDDGPTPGSVTGWLDAWPRSRRLELTRLSDEQTNTMLHDLIDDHPPADLVRLVRDHAAGVPLYVRALVLALIETDGLHHDGRAWVLTRDPSAETPATVRLLVLDRLALRDEADRVVLRTLSLGVSGVPYDVLAHALDLSPEDLLAALARLTAAGLVDEEADDEVVYRVEHPLVRRAVADDLGVLVRRRLHARLFQGFVDLHPEAVHDQASHAVAAGTEVDPSRALSVVLDVLRSTAALDDVVELALAARRLAQRSRAHIGELVEALELLGQALEYRGERFRAGAAWDEALRHAEGIAPSTAARLHRRRALLAWDRLDVDTARDHLQRALAVAADDGPERAAALHTRLMFADPGASPATVADDVAELRRLRGDPQRDPVEGLLGQCWSELNGGRFHTARLAAESVLSSRTARDDSAIARRAHLETTLACWMLGDHRGLLAHAQQATADDRVTDPALRAQAEFRVGIAEIMAGDIEHATERLRPAVAAAEHAGSGRILVACAGVLSAGLSLAGDTAAARKELHRAQRLARDVPGSRAMLLVDWAAAILAVDGDRAGRSEDSVQAEEVVPRGWEHFPPFAVLAVRHAHRRGDRTALRRLEGTVGASDGPYAAGVARLAAGLVADLDGAPESVAITKEAAAGFEALELPRETAIARFHAGDVESLFAAWEGFRRLGDRWWAARCRSALRALGVPAARLRTPGRTGDALSPRDLEVARLVAAGHTNAAVARELTVSVRTVTSHLEHIYRRLGLPSRTALASWLHDHDDDP
ncbi:ATP-binding protein [Actinomycetospora sp. CA-101289]|uniref:ATP-binding protein n=1 Tax=Actinomycetospora sp. CA-101289 TaxID=3239893 RepID=UPI003D99B074